MATEKMGPNLYKASIIFHHNIHPRIRLGPRLHKALDMAEELAERFAHQTLFEKKRDLTWRFLEKGVMTARKCITGKPDRMETVNLSNHVVICNKDWPQGDD